MVEYKYIVVDGLIKTGKTKLAEIIAKEFNARLILDNQENPFMKDFYKDVSKGKNTNSLKSQLIFLLNRYSQLQEIKQKGLFQKTTVSDYLFFRDGIYAHVVLNDDELGLYKKMFNIFSQNYIQPDIVIYLQISFAEMIKRIHESDNELEKAIPVDYWREIFEAYNYYFFNYKNTPLLVVNMEKIDLYNQTDMKNLMAEIRNHRIGTAYYAPA